MNSFLPILRDKYRTGGIGGVANALSLGIRSLTEDSATINGVTVPLQNPIEYRVRGRILAGNYEAQEMAFVDEYLPRTEAVIELGAGIGVVSAYIDGHIADGPRHVALEANPDLIPILEDVRTLNDCDFDVENLAYSPERDRVRLSVGSTLTRSSVQVSGDEGRWVEATNLEGLVEEHDMGKFALVADIEGGEFGLLRQELDLLERRCPLIIVEFHRHVDEAGVEEAKRALGRTFTLVEENGPVCAFTHDELYPEITGSPTDARDQ